MKGVVSTAEILSDKHRDNIGQAFNVKVHNQYGCNEAAISAFECDFGNLHYINTATKLEFDDDEYNIVKISPYKVPEQIHDYQTKNRISVETFINKYLSKTGVKLVSKLNNKIVVQNEDNVNLFTMKNELDAQRLIENLTQRFIKLKRGDCMFVLDVSSPQRKYLYKLLIDKGYDVNYLYRKETTY